MNTTTEAKPMASKLFDIDEDVFTAHFDNYPFKLRHHLVDHPLLQLPRLVQLAESRGNDALYFRGDHKINQVDDGGAEAAVKKRTFIDRSLERPKLSAAETIAQIESCNAWLQLRDVAT